MSNSRLSGLVVGAVVSAAAAMSVALACSGQDNGSNDREQGSSSSERLIQAPTNGGVITIAGPTATGSAAGFVDHATATLGKLNDPAGVAVASDGTIYVADWGNNAVRRITPAGALETLLKAATPNAVKNPRAEQIPAAPTSPPPQWTVVSGTWRSLTKATCATCGDSFDGSRWFGGVGGELRQDIDLTPYQGPGIGPYYLAVDTRVSAGATARIKLEFLSTAGTVVHLAEDVQSGAATWVHTGRIGQLQPPAKVRISLIAGGTAGAEAYFDSVQLRLRDATVPGPVQQMHGVSSIAIASTGTLLVGATEVYSMTTAASDQVKILDTPGTVTNIAPVSDGYAYFVDSTQRDLYVRSSTGVNYRAFVDGEANGEPMGVAAMVQGAGHRLWVTYRGYPRVYQLQCPKGTTAGQVVTCTYQNVRLGGTRGFADDMDGTAGGERFNNPHGLAFGKFGDLLVADEGSHTVRRSLLPLTQTSAGTGVLGFKDGASGQAQFWSPSGVASAPDGSIVVADRMNNRIRKILCGATNACAASGNSCAVAPTDDNNSCTSDSCLVLAVRNEPLANGTVCSDNSVCTVSDSCSSGTCLGTLIATDDSDPCTIDSCDSTAGVAHTPKTFTDTNTTDCLIPTCDSVTGNAKSVPGPEGTACGAANSGRYCDHAGVCEATPAPTFIAPELDTSTGTDFAQLTDGIWKGASAIQTGVAANRIERGHAGWLIGKVRSAAGNPLPNVEVSIAGDVSYGKTRTRGDGHFDLIVNGGRSYTVRFEKTGHLPVDRQVYVGWEETSLVGDVILLTLDPSVTSVSFGATGTGSATQQIAVGTRTSDAEGERTGKLLLPKGIKATIGGNLKPSLNLRITEYTVGAEGPVRMPAPLPPSSAYTYAVEISADEANGQWVQFSKPAYYYVENFISRSDGSHPEVGSIVPSGYYGRAERAWLPSANGIVIKVLGGKQSIAAGSPAEIDVNNDGVKDLPGSLAMLPLNFTNDELIALREYSDGQTLWRIPIEHMTSWDFNFARSTLCADACKAPLARVSPPIPPACSSSVPGSIIGCESQSLGETINVAGTTFSLNYSTERQPLYSNWRNLTIHIRERPQPLGSQAYIAAAVTVTIAGKTVFVDQLRDGPAVTKNFSWDGLDAFGRPVVGSATATIETSWYGKSEIRSYTDEFGKPQTGDGANFILKYVPFSYQHREVTEVPGFAPLIGKNSWSLGGWTLSPHHFYDVKGKILYEGSGRMRLVEPGLFTLKRVMGSGGGTAFAADDTSATASGTGVTSNVTNDFGFATASNGDIYYTDPNRNVIRRINALGQVRTIAGSLNETRVPSSNCNPGGDGQDSVDFGRLALPRSLAFGRDGQIYFYDRGDRTIRVLTPTTAGKFKIDTVAGVPCTVAGSFADNVMAKDNPLPSDIDQIAVGPDGAIYFGDRQNRRIRRFREGGKIVTVAGNGSANFQRLEGAMASAVGIGQPTALAVGLDGSVYSSNGSNLFKVTPDGKLTLLSAPTPAGTNAPLESVPAIDDYVYAVSTVAVAPDATVIFNDGRAPATLRQIDPDGIVRTISRAGSAVPNDGSAALGNGTQNGPATRVAIAPDGSTLVFAHNSIHRISTGQNSPSAVCEDALTAHIVPSGDEAFCFDANGRHLSTVNRRTGKGLLTFQYNSVGVLISITDANGLMTKIDVNNGFRITAPFLQSTTISTTPRGNATSIGDSLGRVLLTPMLDGQLNDLTDRNGNQFFFGFTDRRLTSDRSPLSSTPQTLVRSEIAGGYRVTHTTPLQRQTHYDVIRGSTGQYKSVVTFPNGTQRTRTEERDGTVRVFNPDGTVVTTGVPAPDPVWGFKEPIPGKRTTTLPAAGLAHTRSEVVCPMTISGSAKTQFSAVAHNPSRDLACNANAPNDPLVDQTSPPFTNPPHSRVKRVWDTTGEAIARVSAAGRSQTENRDAVGRVKKIQIGSLTPTLFTYDTSAGHEGQLHFIDRGVRRTQLDYRSKYESDPTNQAADVDAGFVKAVKNPLGVTTEFSRDIFGRPKKFTEAKSTPSEGTTELEWDKNGNMSLVKLVGRPAHDLRYNAINLLDLYTPPALADVPSPATSFATTADRTPDTEARPDGVTIQASYVASPTKTEQLDKLTFSGGSSPSGIVDYEYFLATDSNFAAGQAPGKLKSIAGPYGTTLVQLKYNGSRITETSWSKVLNSAEASASVAWTYDSMLLRTSEKVTPMSGSALSRYFGYDSDNLLVCNSSSTGAMCGALAKDDLKLIRSAEHGAVTGLAFGGLARLAERWDYTDSEPDADGAVDGVDSRFGELRAQILRYGDAPATATVASLVYDAPPADARDSVGRIVTKTETLPGTAATDIVYSYDERGRLYSVDAGADSEAFGYDANGNRVSFTPASGPSLIGKYDDQDRLNVYGTTVTGSAVGDIKYSYGKNGELSKRDIRTAAGVDTWSYVYDALGNLVTVTRPGTSTTTYTYLADGMGRRIGKKEKVGTAAETVTKRWVYRNQLSPVAELKGNGSLAALFVYGSRPNIPDLVLKPYLDVDTVKYRTYRLFSDQLGSPRLAVNVDDKDDIPYRVDYSAFGVPKWKGTGNAATPAFDWIPFGFAGGMYDNDTGLVRFGARDYDPTIGRWVSKDPIRFSGRQGNLYVYAYGDPVNYRDPTGREGIIEHLIGEIPIIGPLVPYAVLCAKNPTLCKGVAAGAAAGGCFMLADALYESGDEMDKRLRDDMAEEYNRSFFQNAEGNQSQDTLEGGESFDPYSGGMTSLGMSIGP